MLSLTQLRKIRNIKHIAPYDMFTLCEAIFLHDGDPNFPHALLTDGKTCSTGYIKTSDVTMHPNLKGLLVTGMLSGLEELGIEPGDFDAIISSSMAALTIGDGLSEKTGAIFAYTEKKGEDQVWTSRFEFPPGIRVIHAEELITKTKTVKKVHDAFVAANPEAEFVKVGGKNVVVNVFWRPPDLSVTDPDFRLVNLIEKQIVSRPISECDHCQIIQPISPKTRWSEFIAHMQGAAAAI